MGIGNVVKRVATGVGGAAASVGKSLANTLSPGVFPERSRPSGVLNPAAAPEDEMEDFKLPDLDPNDPDIEEKTAIHDAYSQLADLMEDPDVDYRAKYKEMADYVSSKPEPRRWSPLAGFAIGMGNPGALAQVAQDNRAADKTREDREEEIARIQEEAIKGEISQHMQSKNFKKALTQSKALADLETTRERIKQTREHTNKLAEIEATNKGKENVAKIKAASAEKTVQERAKQMVDRYRLDAASAKALYAIAGNFVSNLQKQNDAAGEPVYDRDEVEKVLYKMVDFAEEHMDSRSDEVNARETAPPKPGGTVAPKTSSAGPGPNPAAAAAFARRRSARAQEQPK